MERIDASENIECQVSNNVQNEGVILQNVWKSYGYASSKTDVLKGISLLLPKGKISALLGPSGCGKTTLIRLIIGRLKLDFGSIEIFGNVPGTKKCGIPGAKVGYMPQELSLDNALTIEETLNYFGQIFNMSSENIRERRKFLLDFLRLQNESAIVANLSCGQKRRVSFAVALLQNPPLLILDEPTVGVDPSLRKNIWNYLVELVTQGDTTVILTTHYIEEARQANMVAMMRHGRILAHNTPENLISKNKCANLEDVFLKLCDAEPETDVETTYNTVSEKCLSFSLQVSFPLCGFAISTNGSHWCGNYELHVLLGNIGTFEIHKNSYQNVCYLRFSIWQMVLPVIMLIMTCLTLYQKPENLSVGFVNYDVHYSDFNFGEHSVFQFLDRNTITLQRFTDLELAFEALQRSDIRGLIHIPVNFSKSLVNRLEKGVISIETRKLLTGWNLKPAKEISIQNSSSKRETNARKDTLPDSNVINVWLDSLDPLIPTTLQPEFLFSLQVFAKALLSNYGLDPELVEIPLKFKSATDNTELDIIKLSRNFIIIGILVSALFIVGSGFVMLSLISEKISGLYERSLVAGVTNLEIMLGHFVSQFPLSMIESIIGIFSICVVFSLPFRGSICLLILIIVLQGSYALFFGLMISTLFEEKHVCFLALLFWYFPTLIVSGHFCTLQCMPSFLRNIVYALPQTYVNETLRAIMLLGSGIGNPLVWKGFLVSVIWSLFLIFIIYILMTIQSKSLILRFRKKCKKSIVIRRP